MTRVKIIKQHQKYAVGQVVELRAAEAKQLLKEGVAIITKDMGVEDYQTTKTVSSNPRQGRRGR